jgi:subtilisin-like proprotein convertase family protein
VIAESGTVAGIKVEVDIRHTFIGDLRVELRSPTGRSTVLHPQLGGSADNLVATYDSATPGILAPMVGQPMKGNWTLNVSDRARLDRGTLRRWSLELRPAAIGPALIADAGNSPA